MHSETDALVRAAAADDIPRLAEVLGRAFHNDPVACWILPDAERRRRRLPRVYAMQLRSLFIAQGTTQVAVRDGVIQAGALWNPPGRWKASALVQMRQLPGALRLAGAGFGRLMGVTRALEQAHPRRPHWYLADLGTDPDAQGTGLGRLLLESQLARCDERSENAYLETPGSNVAYYERVGFSVTQRISIPTGPTIFAMWRPPH
jgi:ribosomal protein S18 acetylase RimI-like enzyme